MDNKTIEYVEICRFCGIQKNCGKFIFSTEAVKIGLLTKIKCLFPEEIELINSETILPKFICPACESAISYFYEFHNGVKLVQQNLQKKAEESISHKCNEIKEKTHHICPATEKLGMLLLRLDSDNSIACQTCNVKLTKDQIRSQDRPSLCLCYDCGFKDDTRMFLSKNSIIGCPKCSFVKKKTLEENADKIKQKYECDVCNKEFSCKGHLNRHRLTHFGSKPFSCDDCGASFNQKSALKTHTLIHEKTSPYSCKWCGQQFRHKQTLSNHVMSIHGVASDIANLYECDKCKKKFVHKDKMKRHYRSHSGEKPFKCDYCNKTFTQKINLKTHYKKHESEGLTDLCQAVMDSEGGTDRRLNDMRCSVLTGMENADEFHELSRAVLEDGKENERQYTSLPATMLDMKNDENEFAGMSESVLNDTEKGKIIQELLSLENIPENDSLETFSMVQNEYRRDENASMKNDAADMYFNTPTSSYIVYSESPVLYDLNDVTECSALPTFSSLGSVP